MKKLAALVPAVAVALMAPAAAASAGEAHSHNRDVPDCLSKAFGAAEDAVTETVPDAFGYLPKLPFGTPNAGMAGEPVAQDVANAYPTCTEVIPGA